MQPYTSLPSEDSEKLLSSSSDISPSELPADSPSLLHDHDRLPPRRQRRALTNITTAILLLLGTVSAALFGAAVGRHFPSSGLDLDRTCIRHISKYSMISEDVDIRWESVTYNGSFEKENVYRGDASPAVDAAWEALGTNYRPVVLPEALAQRSGITRDHARRSSKYGGGVPVLVEGLHHLHCLNLLRKALYFNRDYYHERGLVEFSDPDHVQRWHVTHCLDILRQRLMCDVDIGVFGQLWVRHPTPRPWVDFNTAHQCRNFEDVRAWAESHQVPEIVPKDWWEYPGPDVHILDEAP